MDVICQTYSDSEDCISLIARILSNDNSAKYEEILKKFKFLGIQNVKDLAQITLTQISQLSLGGDPLSQLSNAIQTYDETYNTGVQQLFKSAKSLYEKGDYAGSQEECERLYALRPNNLNVNLLLSSSYFKQGKFDKSLESLHKVPDEYRECVEVINNIAANHLKKNEYPEACKAYHLAVSKKEDFIECWFGYILTLIKLENYENALRAIFMVIQYNPALPKSFMLYGQLLIKLNRFDEACLTFQLALQLEPESDASWIGLGDSFAYNKKFYSAIICYEKALQINKSFINSYINLGLMHYQLKQFDKTIYYLKTAIQMDPTKNYILPILGEAYYCNGNFVCALKTFSLYLKNTESNNPVVLHKIGLIHLNHFHNAADAEPFFKLCIELDEKNDIYYKCLATVYQQLDRKDLAFKTILKCSEIQKIINNYTGGINALRYASNLFPRSYYSLWKLGLMVNKIDPDR